MYGDIEPQALLRARGLRVTRPRLAVLDILARAATSRSRRSPGRSAARLDSVSTQAVYDVLGALVPGRPGPAASSRPAPPPGTRRASATTTTTSSAAAAARSPTSTARSASAPCLDPAADPRLRRRRGRGHLLGPVPGLPAARRPGRRGLTATDAAIGRLGQPPAPAPSTAAQALGASAPGRAAPAEVAPAAQRCPAWSGNASSGSAPAATAFSAATMSRAVVLGPAHLPGQRLVGVLVRGDRAGRQVVQLDPAARAPEHPLRRRTRTAPAPASRGRRRRPGRSGRSCSRRSPARTVRPGASIRSARPLKRQHRRLGRHRALHAQRLDLRVQRRDVGLQPAQRPLGTPPAPASSSR